MANEQNLRPCEYKLSQEEAKRGGIASVKARRRRKHGQELVRMMLQMDVTDAQVVAAYFAQREDEERVRLAKVKATAKRSVRIKASK